MSTSDFHGKFFAYFRWKLHWELCENKFSWKIVFIAQCEWINERRVKNFIYHWRRSFSFYRAFYLRFHSPQDGFSCLCVGKVGSWHFRAIYFHDYSVVDCITNDKINYQRISWKWQTLCLFCEMMLIYNLIDYPPFFFCLSLSWAIKYLFTSLIFVYVDLESRLL